MTIVHEPEPTGDAVFKFAENLTTDHAEAPDVRVKGSLQCACGRGVQPYDVEADDQRVRIVCPRCHTELLAVEF